MSSTTERRQRRAPRIWHLGLLVVAAFATTMAACTKSSLTEPDQSADKCQVTLTAPQAAIPGGGGTGSVAINATAECAWTASTTATWISNLTPASGQGAGNVQFTAAPNPVRTPREADIDVNGALARVRQDAAVCTFTVAPTALSVPGGGGTGSVTVTTLAGCTWSAASQTPWITITSQADNNDGSGTVTFTAAQNPTGATRTGTLTVAGQTITVTQTTVACGYSISPASYSVGNSGGTTTVAVTTTQACAWTAVSNAPWITVTSGASGTGPGSVGLTVAANTGGARNGTVLIAGQAFTVNQSADACAYTVAPLNQSVGDGGGAATPITVTTASHCTWTAASNDAWLTIPSGTSGTGNGTVQVNVAANSGATRAGTLTIAGQTVTITQTAAGCSYNVSPLNPPNVGVNGNSGSPISVSVTTASHCTWTAVSNDGFVQVSAAGGTGTGSVQLTVSANTGGSRTGTVAIAGSTVTVNQDACSYTLGAGSVTIPATGANNNTVSVTTNGNSCAWTASESESWIAITAGTPGTGGGQVTFNVDPNTGAARSGVITIAGQSFTVNQDALICNNSINPTSETVVVSAGTGTSIAVTTSAQACPWTAVSNAGWITVTSGTPGTGNGTVGWTFAGNTGAQRSGTMTIAGQTFTATQDACTYSLNPTSASLPAGGGTGNSISVTTNGSACQWTASTADSWITIDSGSPGTGNGTVMFTVQPQLPMAPARSGTITVGGQTFTVSQSASP